MQKNRRVVVFGVLPLSAALILLYALTIGTGRIDISEVTVYSGKFNASFPGMKIVLLSDLHMRSFRDFHSRVAARIAELDPDLIVFTGDFLKSVDLLFDWQRKHFAHSMEEIEQFLGMLDAPLGIWAVRGNYETAVQSAQTDELLERLRKSGLHVLTNQRATITVYGETVELVGVDFYDLPGPVYENFKVRGKTSRAFAARTSKEGAFSYYLGDDSAQWFDYTFSGRMRVENAPDGEIGVLVYSQMNAGYDHWYRLSLEKRTERFILAAAHSGNVVPLGMRETSANFWYRFKVKAQTPDSFTRLSAKVWGAVFPEPDEWQAILEDSSAARCTAGSIGIFGDGYGEKLFDAFVVSVNADGRILYRENFESYADNSDPRGWLDRGVNSEWFDAAFEGAESNNFLILLAHSPDLVFRAAGQGVDLMLSGHTHGGQIRLPLIGALMSPARLGPRYTAGLYSFDETQLYINRGLGTGKIPLRLFCPPEITVISLKSGGK